MDLKYEFNSELVEDNLILDGNYGLVVSRVEACESKNGHFMLCFEFTISDGPFEGRKLFENFLVKHPTAGNFSRQTLKQLSEACLLPKWEDASELKGKYFTAYVSQKEDNLGVKKNRVSRYKEYDNQSSEYNKSLSTQDIPF